MGVSSPTTLPRATEGDVVIGIGHSGKRLGSAVDRFDIPP